VNINKGNGRVVPCHSLLPLKVDERHSVMELKKQAIFDGLIESRWGTSINPTIVSDAEILDDEYEDDEEAAHIVPGIEDTVETNGQLLNQQPAYNRILHSEVSLQLREEMSVGKVTKCTIDPDGTKAGSYDEDPYLNSMVYEVEFPDRQIKEYAASA
jgi:hypothetical protein